VAVFFRVPLGRFGAVVSGVMEVSVSHVGVVRGLLVLAGGMMLRGLAMVLGRVIMMLRRLGVVLRRFLGHGESSNWRL
jgi:hypothetical protein